MDSGKIILEDGTELLYEIDEPFVGPVSSKRKITKIQDIFDPTFLFIKGIAKSTNVRIKNMEEKYKPNEFELTFGIKLSTDIGVVIAKAGSEGIFEITLKWKSQ